MNQESEFEIKPYYEKNIIKRFFNWYDKQKAIVRGFVLAFIIYTTFHIFRFVGYILKNGA